MNARLMLEAFEIVQDSWDLAGADREIMVNGRCDGRPELLEAVESIEAAPIDGDFDGPLGCAIKDLLPEMRHEREADRLVNTVVGPYRVGQLLGEGGMGRVYRAVHLGHGGAVAFKVMHARPGSGQERVARLRYEANLLARCHHVGIVQIHHLDALPDGGVYFTMELVEGLPLVEYASTESMSFDERLRLFLRVCDAVQAAHDVGVIHRDLKPNNIIGSREGVKLLDFGVAETFGDTDGAYRSYISAPYAAPEHLGETTTRTDVYSLGVLLAELTLNRLPFNVEASTPTELRRQAMEADQPPLRRWADDTNAPWLQSLGRLRWSELEAICNRAMQVDPVQRYGSVSEMAADVGRLLEGRPVAALRQTQKRWTSLYLSWRLLRRHAVAAVVIAALLVLGAVSLTSYLYALRASRVIAQKQKHAEEQRRRQQDLVQSLFLNGDGSVNSHLMTKSLLERAIHQAQVIAIDPEQKAGLYKTFGSDFQVIGDYQSAGSLFQQALALNTRIYGADSPEAADIVLQQANLKCADGDFHAGVALARQARATLLRILAETAIPVLEADVAEAECLIGLSDYERAKPLLENAVTRESSIPDATADLSTALTDLGNVESYLGHYKRSIDLQQQSMAIDRANEGPRHPDIGEHLLTISNGYVLLREPAEATYTAREALDILSESLGPKHHDVLAAERQLASSLVLEHNYGEADVYFKQALDGLEREAKGSQTEAVTLLQYADSLRGQGRFREALDNYRNAFRSIKTLFPTPNMFWASAHFGLATTFYLMEEQKQAEPEAREALRLDIKLFGGNHVRTLQAQVLLARILLRQGKSAEARDLLERCKRDATGSDNATQQVRLEVNNLMRTVSR